MNKWGIKAIFAFYTCMTFFLLAKLWAILDDLLFDTLQLSTVVSVVVLVLVILPLSVIINDRIFKYIRRNFTEE